MNINYTDCRFPDDTSEIYNAEGEKEMGCESFVVLQIKFLLTF